MQTATHSQPTTHRTAAQAQAHISSTNNFAVAGYIGPVGTELGDLFKALDYSAQQKAEWCYDITLWKAVLGRSESESVFCKSPVSGRTHRLDWNAARGSYSCTCEAGRSGRVCYHALMAARKFRGAAVAVPVKAVGFESHAAFVKARDLDFG